MFSYNESALTRLLIMRRAILIRWEIVSDLDASRLPAVLSGHPDYLQFLYYLSDWDYITSNHTNIQSMEYDMNIPINVRDLVPFY